MTPPTGALSRVAFLLGYGDATAFARAFERWFDEAPGQYRARAGAER